LKFFMDSRQLTYSTAEDTICYKICTDLGLSEMRAASWWEANKLQIAKTLNSKRADVTSAIKRVFMSKYKHNVNPPLVKITNIFFVDCL
jgi:hypothetical protein